MIPRNARLVVELYRAVFFRHFLPRKVPPPSCHTFSFLSVAASRPIPSTASSSPITITPHPPTRGTNPFFTLPHLLRLRLPLRPVILHRHSTITTPLRPHPPEYRRDLIRRRTLRHQLLLPRLSRPPRRRHAPCTLSGRRRRWVGEQDASLPLNLDLGLHTHTIKRRIRSRLFSVSLLSPLSM